MAFWGIFCGLLPNWALAQGPSTNYHHLRTASGLAVSDTLSGMDLQVITIAPFAAQGSVDIQLIGVGNGNNPNHYRVRYTPAPGFSGVDYFTLELNQFLSYPYLSYRSYRVEVQPSNILLKEDYATVVTGNTLTFNVLSNDAGGPFTLQSLPVVNNGTASINGQNQVVFTSNANFTGIAQVQYVACNAANHCATSQLNIGVRPPGQPPANSSLQLATPQNTALKTSLLYGGYTLWQQPQHGTVQVISGRAFRYAPQQAYTGPDQFVLRRSVSGNVSFVTVQVSVLPLPEPNSMAVNDYFFTPLGVPLQFNVRDNDLGNALVTNWIAPNAFVGTLSGTDSDGSATFTPEADFSGLAVFQYTMGNPLAPDLETGTVNLLVSNLDPALDTFALRAATGTPFVMEYPVPHSDFYFEILQGPEHGSCVFFPGFSSQMLNGQPVSGHNLLIYTPEPGFSGTDILELNYCAAPGSACKSTVLRMEVAPTPAAACLQDCVWPGDANADGIVNNKDLLTLGFAMGTKGPARGAGANTWFGQNAANWNNPFAPLPTDLKHADCNGDGRVNQQDAGLVVQNYGRTGKVVPGAPLTKKGLPFSFNVLTPGASVGDLVEVEVLLGAPGEPVTNLYGLTFEVGISPNILDSAFRMEYYPNSWLNLNAPALHLSTNPGAQRLESAFTRTNGEPISGQGAIGKFSFIIIDILDGGRPEDSLFYTLTLTNSNLQWGDGVLTNGTNFQLQVPFAGTEQRQATALPDAALTLYPNPASERLQLQLQGQGRFEALRVLDLGGRLCLERQGLASETLSLDIAALPAGVYLLQATTTEGVLSRRFAKN